MSGGAPEEHATSTAPKAASRTIRPKGSASYWPPASGSSSPLPFAASLLAFLADFSSTAAPDAAAPPSHHGILIAFFSARVLESMTASSPSRGPRKRTRKFLLPATASAPIRWPKFLPRNSLHLGAMSLPVSFQNASSSSFLHGPAGILRTS